jgi:hypothetical protein
MVRLIQTTSLMQAKSPSQLQQPFEQALGTGQAFGMAKQATTQSLLAVVRIPFLAARVQTR